MPDAEMNNTRKAFLLLVFIPFLSYAQDDPDTLLIINEDSAAIETLDAGAEMIVIDTTVNKPNIAALYSAVLPGLGQIYNKKYWKLPLVYGGFVFFGYLLNYNHQVYEETRAALFAIDDGDSRTNPKPPYDQLNKDVLERGNDFYRRNRDFVIILTVAWYALNIVDAHVDGHLNEFTITDDLSLNIRPSSEQLAYSVRNYGVTLTLNF